MPEEELDFNMLVWAVGSSAEAKAQKEAYDKAKEESERNPSGKHTRTNYMNKKALAELARQSMHNKPSAK